MSVVLKNRAALLCRGVTIGSLAGVALITWMALHDRGSLSDPQRLATVLTVLWLTSLSACWYAFRLETVTVQVLGQGRLRLIQSSLFTTAQKDVASDMVRLIALVEERDDEDIPYFRGVLTIMGAGNVTVSEGYLKRKVEGDVQRLRTALES